MSRGKFSSGAIFLGAIVRGAIIRGASIQGTIFLGTIVLEPCFPINFEKVLRIAFFYRTPQMAASVFSEAINLGTILFPILRIAIWSSDSVKPVSNRSLSSLSNSNFLKNSFRSDLEMFFEVNIHRVFEDSFLFWYNREFCFQWLYFANLLLTEAVAKRCSVKKVLLEISQNSQENSFVRVSFLTKLQEKGTLAQVFSSEFCEISKNTFFLRTLPVAASILSPCNFFYLKIILQILLVPHTTDIYF